MHYARYMHGICKMHDEDKLCIIVVRMFYECFIRKESAELSYFPFRKRHNSASNHLYLCTETTTSRDSGNLSRDLSGERERERAYLQLIGETRCAKLFLRAAVSLSL